MGPEAIQKYIAGDEYIRRLAAAQGIDVLNLIKTQQQLQQEMQTQQQSAQQMELVKQEGQMMSAPINDPSKNPALNERLENESTDEAAAQEAGPA
jgi:DNA-directed RNA polymerase sigma subunit (sigma70/sigma32)